MERGKVPHPSPLWMQIDRLPPCLPCPQTYRSLAWCSQWRVGWQRRATFSKTGRTDGFCLRGDAFCTFRNPPPGNPRASYSLAREATCLWRSVTRAPFVSQSLRKQKSSYFKRPMRRRWQSGSRFVFFTPAHKPPRNRLPVLFELSFHRKFHRKFTCFSDSHFTHGYVPTPPAHTLYI